MKVLNLFLVMLAVVFINCKREVSVSMINATSSYNNLPFALFNGEKWQAEENAEYVKFHIYLDEPFQLSKLELNSCEKTLLAPIEVFINFDEFVRSLNVNDKKATYQFSAPVTARSITFNFEKNQGICLSSMKFYDEKNKQLKFKTPRIVKGTASASETSRPEESYGIMNLFDSRFEYAYASIKGGKGVTLKFLFEKEEKIEALRVWNGYQRSDIHCIDNGRVKSMFLRGENYEEKVTLDDIMGSQLVKLNKPFQGKELSIVVDEIYKGRDQGIVISELRFFDGKEWFMLDPMPKYQEIASANSKFFKNAGLSGILNKSIVGGDKIFTGDEVGGRDESTWTFRFRSDGSMYLEGYTKRVDDITTPSTSEAEMEYPAQITTEIKTNKIYGLGNYEVLNKTENSKKLSVRVFGFLREIKTSDISTEEMIYGDCNGCGRDCNQVYSPSEGIREKIFQEFLDIEQDKEGNFIIRNKKRTNNLDFDELIMRTY